MREEQGVAQVLAVISGKGGTGKTSLCAGIASCLAMDGLRVLCIDLDSQAHLSRFLGWEGGSITILATALVETGSRMDEVIFEEFKGTGNMELHLDRRLSEKRIFPAISLNKSGTRREDLLMDQEEMEAIWAMRRAMANRDPQDVTSEIIDNLAHTRTNKDFIQVIKKVLMD